MITKINESEGLLADKILVLTGKELEQLLMKVKQTHVGMGEVKSSNDWDMPRMAFGIKELARILKVSVSTVSRWRADGFLDDVTFKRGRYISFDVTGVIEKLRESNKKRKEEFNEESF